MRKKKIYAIYKGEKFLFEGTAKECAEYFGIKEETVWWLATPSNLKRDKRDRMIAIKLEEEEK